MTLAIPEKIEKAWQRVCECRHPVNAAAQARREVELLLPRKRPAFVAGRVSLAVLGLQASNILRDPDKGLWFLGHILPVEQHSSAVPDMEPMGKMEFWTFACICYVMAGKLEEAENAVEKHVEACALVLESGDLAPEDIDVFNTSLINVGLCKIGIQQKRNPSADYRQQYASLILKARSIQQVSETGATIEEYVKLEMTRWLLEMNQVEEAYKTIERCTVPHFQGVRIEAVAKYFLQTKQPQKAVDVLEQYIATYSERRAYILPIERAPLYLLLTQAHIDDAKISRTKNAALSKRIRGYRFLKKAIHWASQFSGMQERLSPEIYRLRSELNGKEVNA